MYAADLSGTKPVSDVRGQKVNMEALERLNEQRRKNGDTLKVVSWDDVAAEATISGQGKLAFENSYAEQVKASQEAGVKAPLDNAKQQYTDAFSQIADKAVDFDGKITYGSYNTDVSIKDINLDAVDKMNDTYDSYKKAIESNYIGAEKDAYMRRLDDAYNDAFSSNILKPVQDEIKQKMYSVRPQSEEIFKSWKIYTVDKDTLSSIVSDEVALNRAKNTQYKKLQEGTSDFTSLLSDPSKWHDTNAVRSSLTKAMNAYSSTNTQISLQSVAGTKDREYANAISKKISDQYAASHQLKDLGSNSDAVKNSTDGMSEKSIQSLFKQQHLLLNSKNIWFIDFSQINDLAGLIYGNAE